jgi:hypothetical protein
LPGTPTAPATTPSAPAADLPPPAPTGAPTGVVPNKPTPRGGELPPDLPTRGATVPAAPPGAPPAPRQDVPSLDPLIAPPATRPAPVTVPDGGTTSVEARHATATAPASIGPALSAMKYRILLRVGEGEPTFEVKCGDELVLKVTCEKIDIKSPEKGGGPSMVKASGKVRFAGFGAEGVCEELSFLAGTGEVMMAGAVNIKVKDKLGRVESEFSTESAKYKLDPHAPAGSR